MRRKQRAQTHAKGRSVPWFNVLVVVVVLVGAYFGLRALGVFDSSIAQSGPQIDPRTVNVGSEPVGQKSQDQGRDHIPDSQRFTSYNSTPPTSGPHWGAPLPWSNYDSPQPDERVVHNLEHGGIVISYNQIPEEDLAKLKALRSRYPRDRYGSVKIVTRPYDKISPGTIALAAWTWLDTLQAYDEQRILRFLVAHMNECCEPVP